MLMLFSKVNLKTPYISMYIEGDQGLIYHHHKQTLYSIDVITVALVCAVDEGLCKKKAIDDISQSGNYSSDDLESYYLKAIAFFSSEKKSVFYTDGKYPEVKNLSELTKVPDDSNLKCYKVGDTFFSIKCCNDELSMKIACILRPIRILASYVHFEIIINKSKNDANYINIFCNDLLIEKQLLPAEVLPLIIDSMQILTYQHSDYSFCFHGAALETPEGMLLLPGVSGAGKSTLSAMFVLRKCKLYSDEYIVLDKDFNLKTLMLPIAIKSGSWDLLSKHYPELNESPEFLRLDGRRLKYIWPPSFSKNTKLSPNTYRKTLILNPKFSKNNTSKETVRELSVISTLTMLIGCGYQVGIELNEEKIEKLLAYIQDTKRYHIHYHNNEQVQQTIKSMWEF